MQYFIDVILPIPLEKLFTYRINEAEASFLKPGIRVAVPFGKSRIYTALVYQVHNNPPATYEAKEIHQILDEHPLVNEYQLKHWSWLANYYMCSLGEVFRAAVPGSFLLESETIVSGNSDFQADESELKDEEWLIYEALQHQTVLRIHEISDIVDRKNVLPVLKGLLDKNVIRLKEEVYEQYKPKLVRYVKLDPSHSSEEGLQNLLDTLSRAPKQKQVILSLFSLSATTKKPIKVKELEVKSGVSAAVIKALIEKKILNEYYIQTDRVSFEGKSGASKELNEYQQKALEEIEEQFNEHATVLLHGVTSSGKTEVYVKLIEKTIAEGKQVLYLLPEIALTTQLIHRLQSYFGEKISIYHSKYSLNERVEVWNNILNNEPKAQIVLGARSSVFLPFSKLGLIIVDEEHETSFKQFDPAPRYHARDAAIVLSGFHKAKALLGSATPAIETFYNASQSKYGLVQINRRYGNVLLPDMELVDIKEKHRKKRMKGHFSDRLMEEITEALENEEQVILFQNRRGYAPIVECNTCGHSPQCPNCDVSLTYHQYKNQLRCHYCGYHMAQQLNCLACGSSELNTKGFGTEQIESELKELFPEAKTGRMDSDTTRGKYGYEKIITAFEQREIDILVGTQMLTKGLDFRNVTLVGIMNADNLLNYPDFRAYERSFQLIQQVAGRAGRTEKRGKVIIQTYNPYHQILQQASMNNFDEMFKDELNERRQYKYPPFYRLIKITLKHKDYNKVNEGAEWLAKSLRNSFGSFVLGPEFPPVARIRNEYIKSILLKIPPNQPLKSTKQVIKRIDNSFKAIANYRSIRIIYNVDNY
ncbi:primosomal protein N' [Leptobacterium flavescens]|uniref:Replication restart protein PriA n=1 Tax=Leptobacterium flavescens TaxID=472055 RepID=A0A6P0UJC3_9FLAO|nr:primosomal protein N' [Leptobacterium flavescens]NER11949.1 primosomal protein N' [Leptobacterium flavescens]